MSSTNLGPTISRISGISPQSQTVPSPEIEMSEAIEDITGGIENQENSAADGYRKDKEKLALDDQDDRLTMEEELEIEEDEEKAGYDAVPDGGIVAWLQVLGGTLMYFNSWGIINSYGCFENYYISISLSNKTASDIAWVGSIQAFILVIMSIVVGPVFDRGYFRTLVISGSVTVVFGMMMTSLCTEYWQVMLAQGIVIGLGGGCLFIPAVAIMSQYFLRRRSFACGIVAAGSSMGGVLYPIIFHRLQPNLGFAWTTRVIAFIMLGTELIAIAVMRVRVMPRFKRAFWDSTAFRDPAFVLFTTVVFFAFAGAYVPYYYIQTYTQDMDIFPEHVAFYMLSILNAGSIVGRVVPNFLADIFGAVNIMIPFTVLTLIISFTWTSVHSGAGVVLFSFCYGVASGAFVSLPPPVLNSLCPDMRVVGTRMGMSFAFASFGLLIGTPVAGALLRSPATYTATMCWCGGVTAVALIVLIMTRWLKVGSTMITFV
ncbi:putative mfs monocarboxylate transporter protein [Lipomyces oligophaga]|uniref:putative mfs monocarboxylate transporter protein n=1 Tax=Lipomyces oligophaga TaxID=45792 RepID=UPI0034CE1302